jgi:hypothetical protein
VLYLRLMISGQARCERFNIQSFAIGKLIRSDAEKHGGSIDCLAMASACPFGARCSIEFSEHRAGTESPIERVVGFCNRPEALGKVGM